MDNALSLHSSSSAASASGRGGRRLSASSLATAARVLELRRQGLDNSTIARRLGVSRRSVVNHCSAAGLERSPGALFDL